MAIDATAQSTTAAGSDSRAGKAQSKLASDMDVFLQMLTTQLRNQDPLSPMESTEFTNQLVQFASVEQQIDANSNLEQMIKMQQLTQMSNAVGYLGTSIEFDSGTLPLQNGRAEFSYEVPEDADEVRIRIQDASGAVIRTIDGAKGAGRHSIVWDAKDDMGFAQPDGPYNVIVSSRKGQIATTLTTTVTGSVTGVTSGDGKVILSLSGVDIPLEEIKSVKQPAAQASAI